ncbi:MAG: hypothetical protein JWO60_281 [Frankiales bacterium]|nr:hypothetical protein [Frankiales bacterium]
MKLEGTLDAFSLPDIFQLLSATKKTGTLHVRREPARHGAIHLREGAITGARAQVDRQELGRRLVGAGLVDDATLAKAVERVSHKEGAGLGRMLADTAPLDAETVRTLASEQAVDAVFDLLRWAEGEFAFVADEKDPDDLGATLSVEQVVTEARRRLEAWPGLAAVVPSPDSVVVVSAAPAAEPAVAAAEWWLMALVDGRRTVGELVALSGKGEYAVVSCLAGLVQRGLLEVRHASDEALSSLHRRQSLLAGLEGVRVPTAPPAAPAPVQQVVTPPPAAPRAPVIPERPEPFVAPRQPEHAEVAPQYTRSIGVSASASTPASPTLGGSHGSVNGATAMQPQPEVAVSTTPGVALDPSVNKSLLLRLIAGVRGL